MTPLPLPSTLSLLFLPLSLSFSFIHYILSFTFHSSSCFVSTAAPLFQNSPLQWWNIKMSFDESVIRLPCLLSTFSFLKETLSAEGKKKVWISVCIHVHISVSMMGGGLSTDCLPLLLVPSYLLSNIPSASKDILKFCSDSHLSQAGGSGREDEVGKLLYRSLSGSTLFIYPSKVLDKRQVWSQASAT